MRSTSARKYRASRFLWSLRDDPPTPVRDLWCLSIEPLMDSVCSPRPKTAAAQPSRGSLVVDASAGATTVGCEAERPADEDEQPILEADQISDWTSSQVAHAGKAAEPDAFALQG